MIEKTLQELQEAAFELMSELHVVACDCGEPYKDSDAYVKAVELHHLLTKIVL